MKFAPFTISVLLIFFSEIFVSCQHSASSSFSGSSEKYMTGDTSFMQPVVKYAKCFKIGQLGTNKIVSIYKPGNSTELLAQFVIVQNENFDTEIEMNRQFSVPLDSIAVFSATQLNALEKLGLLENVIGISEASYIRNKNVQDLVRKGMITELAGSGSFYLEKTLLVRPWAIFYSPYNMNESHPLASTRIPMIPYLDFMEDDPLGRAEWIKFTAVFFGKEKLADSIFGEIEKKYYQYKAIAALAGNKPSVFSDKYFNGQWFVPGGQSYVAKLFADANAEYIWKDNPQSGSFPLDFEVVFNEAGNADFWRIIGSYNEKAGYEYLAEENNLYTHFKAFLEHHVIYCDAENTVYFENSPLEPHVILADLIKAFHPELLPDYQPVYYKLLP